MLSKRLTIGRILLALMLFALGSQSRAAELGEVKVNSHIGQQLSADIELVDLTAADLAEVQAKLAHPDVFKVAGLQVAPVLSGLNIGVARRDNRRFLHLTTLQPVNADVLHIFLELSSGGRQVIRAASLWLTAEPPAQRAARVAATQAVPTPVPAPNPVPAADVAAASPVAQSHAPSVTNASPMESAEAGLNEAAQRAFAYRRQKALEQAQASAAGLAAQPESATLAPVAAAPPSATRAVSSPASTRPNVPAVVPGQGAAPRATVTPQSCAPERKVEAQLQQCQAMTSKLADIEGKVRRLQTAMAAPAVGAAQAKALPVQAPKPGVAGEKPEPAVKVEPAGARPSSAPAKPGIIPVKPGVAADLAGNSRKRLIMIGGGALAGLAALGGMIYFLRKRQAKGPLKIWQSFRKKGAAEAQEAAPEEVEQLAAQ